MCYTDFPKMNQAIGSAAAEGPRDALCHWNSCWDNYRLWKVTTWKRRRHHNSKLIPSVTQTVKYETVFACSRWPKITLLVTRGDRTWCYFTGHI